MRREDMQGRTQAKGALLLLLTALIWGAAFTAQSKGMQSVQAFTFNAVRMTMGAAVLAPFILVRGKKADCGAACRKEDIGQKGALAGGAAWCGILCGEQHSAARIFIHAVGQDSVHHGAVHILCADIQPFYKKAHEKRTFFRICSEKNRLCLIPIIAKCKRLQ